MKVLIVNSYDRGGAANACIRLHKGLLEKGIDSSLLLQYKQNTIPHSHAFKPKPQPTSSDDLSLRLIKKCKRLFYSNKKPKIDPRKAFIKSRPEHLEMFSFPSSNLDITESQLYQEADIINLHWVAGFLDYESFFEKNTKPVIWTLHDMNAFSGGEHYEETYLGIDTEGYPIKRELSETEIMIQNEVITIKKKLVSKANPLQVVSPSVWLKTEAENSMVFQGRTIHHIPYGLDEDIFKIYNKSFSRELLGIPADKKVILFVADSIKNQRKGFLYLKMAFEKLAKENVLLCAVGSNTENLESFPNISKLGSIKDERLMAAAYSAADVFVIPSIMDNLPNTVLESLMCGTPVIGFPVGGIVDMVDDGVNGLLAPEISASGLYETILRFFATEDTFSTNRIRENAKNNYSLHIQAERYSELFKSIISVNDK